MNIEELKYKVNSGIALTEAEAAFFLRNYPYAMAAFMIENNPGGLNQILRGLGYSNLGFTPDKLALARQLQIVIDQSHTDDWNKIINSFVLDVSKISPSLYNQLSNQFSK
jgi:hypothetical protein